MDLRKFFGGAEPGSSLGPCDRSVEGAYRRGYHQAIAEAAFALRRNPHLTADSLSAWVEGDGMHWRKEVTLEQMVVPPAL